MLDVFQKQSLQLEMARREGGGMMYEAPFTVYVDKFCNDYNRQRNAAIELALIGAVERIGVSVDKEKLFRALAYDSDQYRKGYHDGKEAAQPKWISVEERLPTKDDASAGGLVLCICCDENGKPIMIETRAWHWSVVKDFPDCFTHWMQLPEAPKEE